MESLKPKSYPWENVTALSAEITVGYRRLESARAFMPDHLGYISRIFDNTSDTRCCRREIHNYKEVMEFIKKLHVYDLYFIQSEELIPYDSLLQEGTCEY